MIKILNITISDKIVYTILVILIGYLIYKILLNIVDKSFALRMKRLNVDVRRQKTINVIIKNILKYTFSIIALFAILGVLGVNAGAIVTSIGVVGLAIGLAVQDILRDILAGTFILIENQYAIGDIVMIGGFKGEVIFLGLKSTKIRSETGEIKILSNRNISDITNYSLNSSTLFFDLDLSNENDEAKIQKILTDLASRLTKDVKNVKSEFKYLGIQSMGSRVIYRLSVDANIQNQAIVRSTTWSEIKKCLDKNEVRR